MLYDFDGNDTNVLDVEVVVLGTINAETPLKEVKMVVVIPIDNNERLQCLLLRIMP